MNYRDLIFNKARNETVIRHVKFRFYFIFSRGVINLYGCVLALKRGWEKSEISGFLGRTRALFWSLSGSQPDFGIFFSLYYCSRVQLERRFLLFFFHGRFCGVYRFKYTQIRVHRTERSRIFFNLICRRLIEYYFYPVDRDFSAISYLWKNAKRDIENSPSRAADFFLNTYSSIKEAFITRITQRVHQSVITYFINNTKHSLQELLSLSLVCIKNTCTHFRWRERILLMEITRDRRGMQRRNRQYVTLYATLDLSKNVARGFFLFFKVFCVWTRILKPRRLHTHFFVKIAKIFGRSVYARRRLVTNYLVVFVASDPHFRLHHVVELKYAHNWGGEFLTFRR